MSGFRLFSEGFVHTIVAIFIATAAMRRSLKLFAQLHSARELPAGRNISSSSGESRPILRAPWAGQDAHDFPRNHHGQEMQTASACRARWQLCAMHIAMKKDAPVSQAIARYRNEKRIRDSAKPTLLYRWTEKSVYHRILVALDFSEESKQIARLALHAFPDAQFVFLHAFQFSGARHDTGMALSVKQQARKTRLMHLVEELAPTQLTSCVVQYGNPTTVISNYAERMGADLIVMGSPRKKSLLKGIVSAGIMQQIIADTTCDLLLAT